MFGNSKKTIFIWNIHSGKVIKIFKEHKGDIYTVAISKSGNIIVSGCDNFKIKIWNICSG